MLNNSLNDDDDDNNNQEYSQKNLEGKSGKEVFRESLENVTYFWMGIEKATPGTGGDTETLLEVIVNTVELMTHSL